MLLFCHHICRRLSFLSCLFFFNDTATTEIYTLSLHDALPISSPCWLGPLCFGRTAPRPRAMRSEEHTSELQSRGQLVCRLLLEKKKTTYVLSLAPYKSKTTNSPTQQLTM